MVTDGEGVRRRQAHDAWTVARRVRLVVLAPVVGALLVTTAAVDSSAAPSFGDETLRLLRVAPTEQGASVDLAVPWSEAGRTLPTDAFEVSLADEPVVVTADRLTDQPLVVDLIVDPPTEAGGRASLQGALVEFIGQLDPGARVRIVTASQEVDAGQDRAAALDALRDLGSPDPDAFAARLVDVLGTDLPAGTAPASAARVAVISSSTDPIEVLAAATDDASLVAGGELSPPVWARFHAVATAAPTLAAFDTVAQDLRSTYRLAVPGARAGQRIAVQVTTDAGPTRITGTVPGAPAAPGAVAAPSETAPSETAPSAPATSGAPAASGAADATSAPTPAGNDDGSPADRDGGGWLPIILAVLGMIAGVVLCGVGAVLLSRRQRARRDTDPSSAAAEAATPARSTVPRPPVTNGHAPTFDLPLVGVDAAQPIPTPPAIAPAERAPTDPVPAPPPFETAAMVSVVAPTSPTPADRSAIPTPMFSHEREPELPAAPLFDSSEATAPPVAPVFSPSINLETDVRIVRAAAATERAIASLRSVHDERPDPTPRALAVAIEAAASGWLENRRITSDEVVRLLDPDRTNADPLTLDLADGLLDLLEGHDRNVWDLALAFAERLGHPHAPRDRDHYGPATVATSLVEQVAAVVALGESDFVGRLGGMVGRGLLASWPSRTGRLDQLPLIVSPSFAAAADGLGRGSVDPTDLIVGLMAVMEDAAMRMMRSEQGVAALRERYLDEVGRPLVPARGKFADKSTPAPSRWLAEEPTEPDTVHVRLVELIIGTPVVSTDIVAGSLGIDHERATAALEHLAERGWLDRLDAEGPSAIFAERWLAREVLDHATKPFAPEYSPLDPVSIDLTVSFPRSVHHART